MEWNAFRYVSSKDSHACSLHSSTDSCNGTHDWTYQKRINRSTGHWRYGIQSKFLDPALQKKCQTRAGLGYTNDWWKYKKLGMSKKETVVMSQSISTGYIPPPGKFFWASESRPPGQIFLSNSLSPGQKMMVEFPGVGQNFPRLEETAP